MELCFFPPQTSSRHCSQTLRQLYFYVCFTTTSFLVSPAERFIRIEDFTSEILAYGSGRLYQKLLFYADMKHRQSEYSLSQSKLCLCALPPYTCSIDQMLHALSPK